MMDLTELSTSNKSGSQIAQNRDSFQWITGMVALKIDAVSTEISHLGTHGDGLK
jgi:hypothetical protein